MRLRVGDLHGEPLNGVRGNRAGRGQVGARVAALAAYSVACPTALGIVGFLPGHQQLGAGLRCRGRGPFRRRLGGYSSRRSNYQATLERQACHRRHGAGTGL